MHAVLREIWCFSTRSRQSITDAIADEVAQLALNTQRYLRVGWRGDQLGTDVIAQSGLDCVGCVQLENRLHLVRAERIKVGHAQRTQVHNRFDERLPCNTFVDRTNVRADVVGQPHEYFVDRAARQPFEIQRAQRLGCAARLYVRQEAEQPGAGTTRGAHALSRLPRPTRGLGYIP